MSTLMTLSELARAVRGTLHGDGRIGFSSVSTDTRTISPGALFVALRGERFDGHEYARAAREGGAAAALVERQVAAELSQIVVNDTRRALGISAAQWRARFSLPVIAVAGSNGKTTVTQMIGAILGAEFGDKARLATRGNLNNEIGVPLMLWQLTKAHRAAVFELGMNHPGEIATLAEWVRPTVALVNNAQREHQEFMQSVEATAQENGEVIAALPLSEDGVAVFPADDRCAPIWRQLAGTRRVVDFALDAEAVVTATYTLADDGAHVAMATPLGLLAVDLAVTGVHNVRNALAAAACAIGAGIGPASIVAGLQGFAPVAGRGVPVATREGARLIDDSYNANPDSVRAAIDLLGQRRGRRVLVLGDMGEVGDRGVEFHREVGAYARERGVDVLVALGDATRASVVAFGDGAVHCGDVDAVLRALKPSLAPDCTVLVKGSRFMRMERIVQALAATQTEGAH